MNYTDVSLEEMLEARERRSRRREMLIRRFNAPLIQFCINSPGEEKNSPVISGIYSAGLDRLLDIFQGNIIEYSSEPYLNTGPEGFITLSLPSRHIKKDCTELEENHPLGRLWDMDVYENGRSLSRRDFGFQERCCFLCGEPAHECARSRRHSPGELKRHILDTYQSYSMENRIS